MFASHVLSLIAHQTKHHSQVAEEDAVKMHARQGCAMALQANPRFPSAGIQNGGWLVFQLLYISSSSLYPGRAMENDPKPWSPAIIPKEGPDFGPAKLQHLRPFWEGVSS